ncbi:hypothetical protein [Psychrobacter proteolyticus]|uniref:hypothetical protein n=1 Tax=Psychrobacter proteolyticus TaxID=147825 RepID=UPI0022345DEB|nr:hypothetical protein [Psychrobacter proteolyticus]
MVVGEVISVEQHPDADKLRVTQVNIGDAEPLQIVCGAPNVYRRYESTSSDRWCGIAKR